MINLLLLLMIIGIIIRLILGRNKNGEKNEQNLQNSNNTTLDKNQSNDGGKNKISSIGRFLDILGLFFLMFSIFFIRVGGTGLLLLIGFGLLLCV